jgi:hypothetical protein
LENYWSLPLTFRRMRSRSALVPGYLTGLFQPHNEWRLTGNHWDRNQEMEGYHNFFKHLVLWVYSFDRVIIKVSWKSFLVSFCHQTYISGDFTGLLGLFCRRTWVPGYGWVNNDNNFRIGVISPICFAHRIYTRLFSGWWNRGYFEMF